VTENTAGIVLLLAAILGSSGPDVVEHCRDIQIQDADAGRRTTVTQSSPDLDRAWAGAIAALWENRSRSVVGALIADRIGYQARAGLTERRIIEGGVGRFINPIGVVLTVGEDSLVHPHGSAARSCLRALHHDEGLHATKDPITVPLEAVKITESEAEAWRQKGWAVVRLWSREVRCVVTVDRTLLAKATEKRGQTNEALTFAILEATFDLEKAVRAETRAGQPFSDSRAFALVMLQHGPASLQDSIGDGRE